MTIKRTSEAKWNGNITEGSGNVKLGSGAFEGAYSFNSALRRRHKSDKS